MKLKLICRRAASVAGFLALILLVTGCDIFSAGRTGSTVGPNYHPGIVSDVPPVGGLNGVKIAPGSATQTGPYLASTVAVTPTDALVTGSHIRARISIQKYQSR